MKRLNMSAFLLLCCMRASPHSASDAYLTLTVAGGGVSGQTTLSGQWDIALRDLDFVLKLDDDGDGQVSWGETKRHLAAIERYAYQELKFTDPSGAPCAIRPLRLMIDGHADGAYAALFFEVTCTKPASALGLKYSLFFAVDPSHRGIFVFRSAATVSTALFSPQSARITLPLKQ